jgi:hypothetical protein
MHSKPVLAGIFNLARTGAQELKKPAILIVVSGIADLLCIQLPFQ